MKLKNIFKMGKGVLWGHLLKKRIPLNVMFSITNRCLSSCSYCNIPFRKQRELTTAECFDLIDQIVKLGCQRLGIWGGEPLIREDIEKIIDYAKRKGLFVTLDTNGYLIPEKISLLKNLDHLILSFDGPKDMHELNRGEGSFEKTLEAIETIKKHSKINLWTITVLTKYNLEGIDFILDTAKKYGFFATFQLLHHNEILGKNLIDLLPSQEMYKKAIKKLIIRKKEGAPISSSLSYLNYLLNWPDYSRPILSKNFGLKCWAGKLYCNVDTDGSVYPCSLLVEKVPSLNFLEAGFKKSFDFLGEIDFPCKSCLASCYTEYNYLYSLNLKTIFEWLKTIGVKI